MSKHTQGPWLVNGKQSIRGTNGEYIARANWNNGEANARLIAAAPDLLFHLFAAANYVDVLGGDSKAYRVAINKATGGSL